MSWADSPHTRRPKHAVEVISAFVGFFIKVALMHGMEHIKLTSYIFYVEFFTCEKYGDLRGNDTRYVLPVIQPDVRQQEQAWLLHVRSCSRLFVGSKRKIVS
jgi:hypothetical protein